MTQTSEVAELVAAARDGERNGLRRAGPGDLRRHVHARLSADRQRGGRTRRGAGGVPPGLSRPAPVPWRRAVLDVAVPHHRELRVHAPRSPAAPPARGARRRRAGHRHPSRIGSARTGRRRGHPRASSRRPSPSSRRGCAQSSCSATSTTSRTRRSPPSSASPRRRRRCASTEPPPAARAGVRTWRRGVSPCGVKRSRAPGRGGRGTSRPNRAARSTSSTASGARPSSPVPPAASGPASALRAPLSTPADWIEEVLAAIDEATRLHGDRASPGGGARRHGRRDGCRGGERARPQHPLARRLAG